MIPRDITAQDEPSLEVEGAIVTWFVEVIYPEAIRFSVEIGVPAEQIASASLIIEPEDGRRIPVTLTLDEAAAPQEPTTEIVYLWDFSPGEAPNLFTNVAYEWTIATADNLSSRLRHFVPFEDTRIEWRQVDISQNVRMAVPSQAPTTQRLQMAMAPIYELLAANTGSQPDIDLLVVNRELLDSLCTINRDDESVVVGDLTGTEVSCDPEAVRAQVVASGYVLVETDSLVMQNISDLVAARLTEIFYTPLWDDVDVPDWFESGIAAFYAPNLQGQFLNTSLNSVRINSQFTLNEMNSVPDDPVTLLRWKAQSYGMVLYIADQIGVPALFEFAQELGEGESFANNYQSVMGQSLSGLIPGWRSWMFTDGAAAAFTYTPYLAETPTPLPTASPTLFPPTDTPMPTITPTNTPLPTVTGELSATPLPTNTATWTPRPATATVTPRPAGSLPTVTPISAATQNSDESTSLTLAIAIIIGAALVGSGIGFLITRGRR